MAVAAPAARAEPDVTPQALGINGAFMEYLPPPPAPVAVCVIDTGVDVTPDTAPILQDRLTVMGDGQVDDMLLPDGHGTAVASIMGAPRNGTGSVGLWPWVRVVSVRATSQVVNGQASFNWADYGRALEVCRTTPNVKVVNFSLGGDPGGLDYALFLDAVESARRISEINIVAAAGNTSGAPSYPAAAPGVIAIAANDPVVGGALCSFSALSAGILSTPGCGVTASSRGGGESVWNGTSLASPQASALLAALRAYQPGMTGSAAESVLRATARSGADGGSNIVDAASAFRASGLKLLVEAAERSRLRSTRPPLPRIVRRRIAAKSISIEVTLPGTGQHLHVTGAGRFTRISRSRVVARRGRYRWRLTLRVVSDVGLVSAPLRAWIPRLGRS